MKWAGRSKEASMLSALSRLLGVLILVGVGYIACRVFDGIERFAR